MDTDSQKPRIGVARILQWRGVTWWGAEPGDWVTEVPLCGVPGQSPAEAKCENSVQFSTFSLKKLEDLMSIEAELGQYILQTHN